MIMTATTAARTGSPSAHELAQRRLSIGFMNWAHAIDHFVILIYPTVVIELEAVYGQSYSTLIALSTASFVAFGLFSLPAGWLGDRWSRRNRMVAFYFGCGGCLIGAALEPAQYDGRVLFRLRRLTDRRRAGADALRARLRAVHARRVCRDLSSGRHGHDRREREAARPHARLQWRLRQSWRLARGRHYRRAHRSSILAWRISRARRGLHRHRRRLCPVRTARGAACRSALDRARRIDVDDACGNHFRLVPGRGGERRSCLRYHFGVAAEDRRRAHRRHFPCRCRWAHHGGVFVRRPGAAHRWPACRARPAAHSVRRAGDHAVFRRSLVGLRAWHDAAVRARLHDGRDLWPDHRQRSHSGPLQRRRLAQPALCAALLRHLHDFGRGRDDDRIPLWSRRLRARARRYRGGRARLPDRRNPDRGPRQRRGKGEAAGGGAAGGVIQDRVDAALVTFCAAHPSVAANWRGTQGFGWQEPRLPAIASLRHSSNVRM